MEKLIRKIALIVIGGSTAIVALLFIANILTFMLFNYCFLSESQIYIGCFYSFFGALITFLIWDLDL